MIEFSKEELKELKNAVNALISQRITYGVSVKEGSKREKDNKECLAKDYELLDKVIKEIDRLKAEEQE